MLNKKALKQWSVFIKVGSFFKIIPFCWDNERLSTQKVKWKIIVSQFYVGLNLMFLSFFIYRLFSSLGKGLGDTIQHLLFTIFYSFFFVLKISLSNKKDEVVAFFDQLTKLNNKYTGKTRWALQPF